MKKIIIVFLFFLNVANATGPDENQVWLVDDPRFPGVQPGSQLVPMYLAPEAYHPKRSISTQQSKNKKNKTRSITSPQDATEEFKRTAFAGTDKFFLGADEVGQGDAALVRAQVALDKSSIELVGIASHQGLNAKAINHLALAGTEKLPVVVTSDEGEDGIQVHLFRDNDGSKVITHEDPLLDANDAEVDKTIVALAATVPSNLNDIVLFAAVPAMGESWGVGVNDADDGAHRGIAVLRSSEDALSVISPAKLLDLSVGEMNAFAFSSEDDTNIDRAAIGNKAALHWDEHLQRLYVGLTDVQRATNEDDGTNPLELNGGVCSIAVASLSKDAGLDSLGPVVKDARSELFSMEETPNDFLGFYRASDQPQNLFASALNLRTMHTSTCKDYLIVNGGVGDLDSEFGILSTVFAAPLVQDGTDKGFIGSHALGVGVEAPESDVKMPHSDDRESVVGVDHQLLSFDKNLEVTDMQVHGDTVYVSVAGDRSLSDHTQEAGIFASQALFGSHGMVRAWTPWQRVMGRSDVVGGFGFDQQTGNFWYLTTADGKVVSEENLSNTVKTTRWNKGDDSFHGTETRLSDEIQNFFGNRAGVYGLFDFGPGTPGFREQDPNAVAERDRHQQFSMMVATGHNRVMLIETGRFEKPVNIADEGDEALFEAQSIFNQTKDFTNGDSVFAFGPDQRVGNSIKLIRSPALDPLGPITCAEVSRFTGSAESGEQHRGWLFVAGYGGVAVLSQVFDGQGWPTGEALGTNGLERFGDVSNPSSFPGGSRWNFLRLMQAGEDGNENIFHDVRKLVSDGEKFLYILTGDALYRLEMMQDDFKRNGTGSFEAVVPADHVVKIAAIGGSTFNGMPLSIERDQFFELMIVKRSGEQTQLLLGTSQGLFINEIDTLPDARTEGELAMVTWNAQNGSDNEPLGPALRFTFASFIKGNRRDEGCANGNLSVLAFDAARRELSCYRFDVGDDVEPFEECFGTPYFYRLADFGKPVSPAELADFQLFFLRSKHALRGREGFTDKVLHLPDPSEFLTADAINLDVTEKFPLPMTQLVRDSASGGVYVGGEFGVRVNE